MRDAKYAIFLLALAGCTQWGSDCMVTWWKLSDAQIAFSAHGQQFLIGDSTDSGCGITGVITMGHRYSVADSIFYLSGSTSSVSVQFEFLGPIKTGNFILDRGLLHPPDSTHYPLLHGAASVTLRTESDSQHTWVTDSLHTGNLTITSIDSINDLYYGNFSFMGIDTLNSDTMRVLSGTFSKVPINSFN